MDPKRLKELFEEMAALRKLYRPIPLVDLGAEIDANPERWERYQRINEELTMEGELRVTEEQRPDPAREYRVNVKQALATWAEVRTYFDDHEAEMWATPDAEVCRAGWRMMNKAWDRLTELAQQAMTDAQRAHRWVPTEEWALADEGHLPVSVRDLPDGPTPGS